MSDAVIVHVTPSPLSVSERQSQPVEPPCAPKKPVMVPDSHVPKLGVSLIAHLQGASRKEAWMEEDYSLRRAGSGRYLPAQGSLWTLSCCRFPSFTVFKDGHVSGLSVCSSPSSQWADDPEAGKHGTSI